MGSIAFVFSELTIHMNTTFKNPRKNVHTLYSINLKRDNLLKMSYNYQKLELIYCSLKDSM